MRPPPQSMQQMRARQPVRPRLTFPALLPLWCGSTWLLQTVLAYGSGEVDARDSANRKHLPDPQPLRADVPGILGAGRWVWFPDVEAI